MPSVKRKRAHKVIDPLIAAARNIKREINKTEKKIVKLLKLRKEGRKTAKGKLQGMREESDKHKRLKSHIQKLKNRLTEI